MAVGNNGRTKPFRQDVADYICEQLATRADSLDTILGEWNTANPGYAYEASRSLIWRWLRENEDFRDQYGEARKQQAELLGDLAMDEARSDRLGTITKTGAKGTFTETIDNVQRSRLICDTIFKRQMQLWPKRFGPRPEPEGGAVLNPQLQAVVDALKGPAETQPDDEDIP